MNIKKAAGIGTALILALIPAAACSNNHDGAIADNPTVKAGAQSLLDSNFAGWFAFDTAWFPFEHGTYTPDSCPRDLQSSLSALESKAPDSEAANLVSKFKPDMEAFVASGCTSASPINTGAGQDITNLINKHLH